ncbi:Mannan endo-1,4-beta-mannosidase 7 [Camellia lanceoleosa]|uniref:Mannan endo-1,4-beta-mannosidase 7 n=1 Tax=Camellia lanceoleosa TaxID=1840588 RepID=A0ACC0GLE4_9ERIC|nr:Mannan endo-1,4-beta-mannosidase 7 [Camellia lanceoleosa]
MVNGLLQWCCRSRSYRLLYYCCQHLSFRSTSQIAPPFRSAPFLHHHHHLSAIHRPRETFIDDERRKLLPRSSNFFSFQLTFISRQPTSLSFSQDNLLPSVQTLHKKTFVYLTKATETVSLYRNKSKIFILINANGFNAYWLMYLATDPTQRDKVSSVFQQASNHGLTVARTWEFSDGGYRVLQYSPSSYNKLTFQVHGDDDICDVFREIWYW